MPKHPDHGAAEAARHGVARSPHWPAVEKAFRKAHPACFACPPGAPKHAISVHHKWPFHIVVALGRPELELDSRNLISLCETTHALKAENHHLLLGHLDDFRSFNPDVLQDAAVTFHGLTAEQIKADPRWLAKERKRPLDELTDDEKTEIRAMLDRLYPPLATAA